MVKVLAIISIRTCDHSIPVYFLAIVMMILSLALVLVYCCTVKCRHCFGSSWDLGGKDCGDQSWAKISGTLRIFAAASPFAGICLDLNLDYSIYGNVERALSQQCEYVIVNAVDTNTLAVVYQGCEMKQCQASILYGNAVETVRTFNENVECINVHKSIQDVRPLVGSNNKPEDE
uniref:Uncharacterized protein n=1 Tax=Glossina brevipalpis TaxID=37001 RepID=A0A1A9WNI4_9MUSC